MKHLAFIGYRQVFVHSVRPFTHLLIGQLDEEKEKPSQELMAKKEAERTQEERDAIAAFLRNKTVGGRYLVQVLDWFESEAAAEAARKDYPDYTGLRVLPVHKSFANG